MTKKLADLRGKKVLCYVVTNLIEYHINDDESAGPADSGRAVNDDGRLGDLVQVVLRIAGTPSGAHNLLLLVVDSVEELKR